MSANSPVMSVTAKKMARPAFRLPFWSRTEACTAEVLAAVRDQDVRRRVQARAKAPAPTGR